MQRQPRRVVRRVAVVVHVAKAARILLAPEKVFHRVRFLPFSARTPWQGRVVTVVSSSPVPSPTPLERSTFRSCSRAEMTRFACVSAASEPSATCRGARPRYCSRAPLLLDVAMEMSKWNSCLVTCVTKGVTTSKENISSGPRRAWFVRTGRAPRLPAT